MDINGIRNVIIVVLGVREGGGRGEYLGFPFVVGRNKRAIFNFVKDKVWQKINSCCGRTLSMVGREIFIKSVVQAIPIYLGMSIFQIPQSTGDELQKVMNYYFFCEETGEE